MILTITPNPLLERRLTFKSISIGGVNRSVSENFYAGGKGINVSRQLNKIGIKNTALTFLGGQNGKLLRRTLENEGINFNVVSIKSETRYAAVTIDESKNQLTSYFSPNSEISKKEVDEFVEKMDKAIQNSSIVIFAGSAPTDYTAKIFIEGIKLANKHDKISLLDTYGNHLEECIKLSPFAVHNNKSEIENSLGQKLERENDFHKSLNFFYESGIKMAFITDGENPVFASKFDFHYKVEPPKINFLNSLGSGDAFMSGIIYGLDQSLVYDDFLKLAVALGSLNAERKDAANIIMSDAENLLPQIEVKPIGKKMKLIDDSPNY